MVDEFKQNEDVLSLSKFLILGVVATVVLAIVFGFLYQLLTPGFDAIDTIINKFGIYETLYLLSFIIAFLAGFYGLFLQVASDDSNLMRLLTLVYAMMLLSVILVVLFSLFGSAFVNPIPIGV